jgi:polysaccharide deacetylase family protein (PEP-CTERM system associated)
MTSILNALTVDVEDYFQVSAFERVVARDRWGEYESRVAANTDRLLGIFAEAKVRATFFVLGWVAERDPSIVRRIAAAGHEIASHGYGHRLIYDQTPEEFRDDVRRGKALLEAASGRSVLGYRAPSFSITEPSLWALDILIEEGFTYDASIFPIRHDRYGIPTAPRHPFWIGVGQGFSLADVGRGFSPAERAGLPAFASGFGGATNPGDERGLVEIPASTIRLAGMNLPVGGGGYFRLLPYWWTRFGIRRLNGTEGRPAIFYMHPWEVDPEQPRLGGSRLSRFRHYRNLAKTEGRLRRLLSDFRFGTIADTILASASVAA